MDRRRRNQKRKMKIRTVEVICVGLRWRILSSTEYREKSNFEKSPKCTVTLLLSPRKGRDTCTGDVQRGEGEDGTGGIRDRRE